MAADGRIEIDVVLDDGTVARGVSNIEGEFDKLSAKGEKAFKGLASAMKGVGVAAGAMASAGAFAITGLVESTAELNGDLARLRANAEVAGHGFDSIEAGFKKVAAVTGEMDSAVETVSNLMATDFSENQIGEALDYINGAAIKFSDTLKTEGIADGLQETFATGEAIGPFAELLERSGVNLDTFNAGLAKAKKTGSETDYVLQQMAKLGLGSVYEEYQKANPEIVAYNEASTNLQTALANLGLVLTPLVTTSKEFAVTLVELAIKAVEMVKGFDFAGQSIGEMLPLFLENGMQMIQNLINGITNNIPQFVEIAISAIQAWLTNLATVYPMILEAGVQILTSLIEGLVSYLPQLAEAAANIVESVVNTLVELLPMVIETGAEMIQALIEGIVEILPELISTGIELLSTLVTTIVDNLPDLIDAGIQVLNSLIEGILEILPELIPLAMDLLDTIIATIIENLPKIIDSGIKLLLALIDGILKILPELIQTALTLIIKLASGLISHLPEIIAAGIEIVIALIAGLIKAIPDILKALPKIIEAITTAFVDTDWAQIGKDIINGLIGGISSMTEKAIEAVTGVVDGVVTKAKELLGIHSPSRVFKEIGLWTGEGLVIGLDNSSAKVNKAMENIGDGILSVSDSYQEEYLNLLDEFNSKNEEKNDKTLERIYKIQNNAAKKKRKLTKYELQEIALLEATYKESKLKSEMDFNKKYKALVEKSEKEYLDVIKGYIDDKKSLDQLNIIDEARIWEQSIELFAEGSAERIKAQQNYKAAVETVNKEITAINQDYQTQMIKIDEDYVKEAERINKEYKATFDNRVNSLMSFASTFEEFKVELNRTGLELMTNLQSQVDGFKQWQTEFEKLSARGIDGELLNELSDLGVKALPELTALNSMTDEQLSKYSELYREKSALAREQAAKELEGTRKDADQKLLELRATADAQLSKLQTEWDLKIKNLVRATDSELSTLQQVGVDAGQGLLDGLTSMEGPLIDKATQIANAIKDAIQSALDIHSPSRWMRDFVAGNLAKGFDIGVDRNSSVFSNASARVGELVKANVINPLRGVTANLGNVGGKSLNQIQNSSYTNQINNARTMNNQITVGSRDDAATYERLMRRLKFEFGV